MLPMSRRDCKRQVTEQKGYPWERHAWPKWDSMEITHKAHADFRGGWRSEGLVSLHRAAC